MRNRIDVSEYNALMRCGRWIEYDTVEEATAAIEAKAKRSRQFMVWKIFDRTGQQIAEVHGQH